MIRATYIEPYTGAELEVEILQASPKFSTAVVTPAEWHPKSPYYWEKRPELFVERDDLVNLRVVCQSCGEEFDPAGKCEACGWDWREMTADDENDERWLIAGDAR